MQEFTMINGSIYRIRILSANCLGYIVVEKLVKELVKKEKNASENQVSLQI